MTVQLTVQSAVSVYREETVQDESDLLCSGESHFSIARPGFIHILIGDRVLARVTLEESPESLDGMRRWKRLSDYVIARDWYGSESRVAGAIESSIDSLNEMLSAYDDGRPISGSALAACGVGDWRELLTMIIDASIDSDDARVSISIDDDALSLLPDLAELEEH